MAKPKAHVAESKKILVKKLEHLLEKSPIIGIVNMEGLPSSQLGALKKGLRGKADLFMAKRRLITIAFENAKTKVPKLETLIPHLKGMPALLFTKDNPFALYKFLKKSKSPAPAKAGQESPRDITIPAGPTPFAPGPVISELAAIGIKAGVENGKVAVRQDSLVIKQGEKFSGPLASMLSRLGIEPMEIGLNVVAVFEKGIIYDRSVLDVDETVFMANLMTAASEAFNLSVEAEILTDDNKELIIGMAFLGAKSLARESKFLADAIAEEILEQGEREARSLATETKSEVSYERHTSGAQHPNDSHTHQQAEHMLKDLKDKGTLR